MKSKIMKKTLLILSLFFCLIMTAFSQSDSNYEKSLKQMFDLAGTEATFSVAIDQMMGIFKQQYTQVDSTVWNGLADEFKNASLDDLTAMLLPVYQKHLTIDDLNSIIEFYQSPVGKKFATATPLITQESMQIGQEWGMQIGLDFAKKMEEMGY